MPISNNVTVVSVDPATVKQHKTQTQLLLAILTY